VKSVGNVEESRARVNIIGYSSKILCFAFCV